MMLLVHGLWPGLAAAALLGLCVGGITGLPRGRLGLAIVALLGGTLAILAVLAWLGTVPGETGLWIESAALMLAAYLTGCLAGGIGRRFSRRA